MKTVHAPGWLMLLFLLVRVPAAQGGDLYLSAASSLKETVDLSCRDLDSATKIVK